MKELVIKADIENLQQVLDFINEELEAHHCPNRTIIQLDIAVEEIYVNIAHYAYSGEKGNATVQVEIQKDPNAAVITFLDSGIPYNPLAKQDPDISLSVEQRRIGGLGIYMVKKSMDSVSYTYKNGQNLFKIIKNYERKK